MEEMKYVLFTVLGRPVTAYALCIVAALALGLLLMAWQQKKNALRCDTAEIFALLALPLGLVGARMFYCLARLTVFMELGMGNMLRLWDGGYAMWGAAGGAVLAAILTAKITRQSAARILDAMAAPAALVMALGRFAEVFNGEGIGLEVENAFFQRFPFALFNADWEVWFWAICLLEGVVALVILAVLLAKKPGKAGDQAKLFLVLYCSAQILLESLRRDQFLRWLFVRVSQLTAVLVLGGLMFYALYKWLKTPAEHRVPKKALITNWVVFLVCVGLCIAMEFAVDKAAFMPVWLCYTIMGVCCVIFGYTAHQLILKGTKE